MLPSLLLRFYPRSWRERYGDEVSALLEEHRPTFATYVDLLLGAIDANLNYVSTAERVVRMADRLKADIVVRFCAFVLFGLGWVLLVRLNDPVASFASASAQYPGLVILLDGLRLAGIIAALGIAAGGVPLVGVAVRRAALRRQRDVMRAFYWAAACALAFGLATLAITTPFTPRGAGVLVAYLVGSLILLIVGTLAVSAVVLKADLQERELRLTNVPAILVVFGMVGSLVAALALGVLVVSVAPSLLTSQDVSTGMFTVGVLLLGVANVFALLASRRGGLLNLAK